MSCKTINVGQFKSLISVGQDVGRDGRPESRLKFIAAVFGVREFLYMRFLLLLPRYTPYLPAAMISAAVEQHVQ